MPGYSRNYTTDHTYDSYGRPLVTDYPSGFAIKRVYNARGYLSQLKDNSTNAVLQDFSATDAFGNITSESYGNNVVTSRSYDDASGRTTGIDSSVGGTVIQALDYAWRSNGTLERRTHNPTSVNGNTVSEAMTYDSLDRLAKARTYLNGAYDRDLNYNYTSLGNLLGQTSSKMGDKDVFGYAYGTTANAGPHAVSEVSVDIDEGDGVIDVSYTLYYDLNGAIERYDADTGPDKFIEYNAANQPTKIVVGVSLNDPDPIAQDEFEYGPDGARFYKKSIYEENGQTKTSHTFYVGGYENILVDNDPNVIETRKTQVGDAILHVETVDPLQVMDAKIEYLHRDHLGSVDTVTDESGNILQVTTFEPFGARKDSDWLRNIDAIELDQMLQDLNVRTARGFTGHEHLDHTGFIHMNGRVYDPTIGRFLSPDPIVQAPTDSQSWNRYSYVFNSPLSYTDPSGYCSSLDCDDEDIIIVIGGGGSDRGRGKGKDRSLDEIFAEWERDFIYETLWGSRCICSPGTETVLKPEYTSHAGIADYGRPKVGAWVPSPEGAMQSVLDGYLEQTPINQLPIPVEGAIGDIIIGYNDAVESIEENGLFSAKTATTIGEAAVNVLLNRLPGGKIVKKRGPKTDSNAPHNAKVREVGDRIEAESGTIIAGGGRFPEQLIRTPGGYKEGRRPDILYEDSCGILRGCNVGKTKADGSPIKREQEALDDLNGPGRLPTTFERYD